MAVQVWHKAPFIRFLLPLMLGIMAQWYLHLAIKQVLLLAGFSIILILSYSFFSIKHRYKLSWINGLAVGALFICFGALLVWQQDIRNEKAWVGHLYKEGDYVVATISEPLVEKENSYKAIGHVNSIIRHDSTQRCEGDIIFYFKKDSLVPALQYGNQIVFNKALQIIKNSGNPGGFDYNRYALFQGISHQVFLTGNDYIIGSTLNKSWVTNFIFSIRGKVVSILKKYIPGEKESGLAEALLIGYKDDLDKNLVQAYSNTGVVHIIAISGLHLGLIYWLLLWITKPLARRKNLIWIRLPLTIAALWAFTLIAGAQPSVLRSAIMFTIIAFGQLASRRSAIYNTMAVSAFVLLCINPFWLWDVGFQLSYTAVLSIIMFFRPVYGWFYFPNKLIDFFWSLTAVTISAQLLTLPVSVYHFHQLPLLFLFTNFIAVPVSSAIVIGEIFLCAFCFITPLAKGIGWLLQSSIHFMNSYIEGLNEMPFSVWNGLSVSILQMFLLLIFIVSVCYWLMDKKRGYGWSAGVSVGLFMIVRSFSFATAYGQQKVIVYNVPKHAAIDVIDGRHHTFIGDSTLLYDDFIRNFHLQPSRILHRITANDTDKGNLKSFVFANKQMVILDESNSFKKAVVPPVVDLLILSKNPRLYMSDIAQAFQIKQVVIDGSVPRWKAALWQKDCDSLHISCYNVSDKGAFVLPLH